jgi:hypothetical protein
MKKQYRMTVVVVAAIAGVSVIFLAIVIPKLLDTLEKSKTVSCSEEIRWLSTAYFSWLTDQIGSAAAGASESPKFPSSEAFAALPEYPTLEEFHRFLDPSGTRPLPPADCLIEIWVSRDVLAESTMRFRLPGPDGVFEDCSWVKIPVDQLDSCGDDVVGADGFFASYPTGAPVD